MNDAINAFANIFHRRTRQTKSAAIPVREIRVIETVCDFAVYGHPCGDEQTAMPWAF